MTLARRATGWLVRLAVFAGTVLATVLVVFAFQARLRLPDLAPWHRLHLVEEFRAGRADVATFDDYLRLEERLFTELRARILDAPGASDPYALGRYHAGSVPARLALDTPHNRSWERVPPDPRGAVLLVHGLSDSPYSMRALADTFFERGFAVLVLRLPGHGTIPSALTDVRWRDWYAAVDLAARRVADRAGPGKPWFGAGHSTGAALLTLYAARTAGDPDAPRPSRLYLVSPAIGVSRFAAVTNAVSSLSFLPAFEKARWLSVLPEYDPYKYNSFPLNAANQIHHVTRELQAALDRAEVHGRLADLPRIVVFHSIVDDTVETSEIVHGLLGRLPAAGHELVVFDVNRHSGLAGLLAPTPIEYLERIRRAVDLPFRVTLIGNRDEGGLGIAAYTREAGARDVEVEPLPLAWPPGVFSLGHVALPFPGDDPVYGIAPAEAEPRFALGAFSARGEAGALRVPLGMLARLRSNPFFEVIRAKVAETCCEDPARP